MSFGATPETLMARIMGFLMAPLMRKSMTACLAKDLADLKRFIEAGEDEYIYARYGNPTVRMFEERIAALEGAEDAFATASGMAAVSGALLRNWNRPPNTP